MTSAPTPETGHRPSLLVVDDDETLRHRMARALGSRGYDVRTAGSVDEALEAAKTESPEYALVDLRMPGRSGLELVAELKKIDDTTKVFVLTAYGSIPTAIEATKLGVAGYLQKPVDAEEVAAALAGAPLTEAVETPTLARAEWEYIQRVLTDCAGNVSEAARRLGIHRRSLQRKLQKHPPLR